MIPFRIWGGNWSHSRQIFLICLDRRTARAWLIHKTWVRAALSGWKQLEMSRCSCFSARTTETRPVSVAFLSQRYIRSVQLKYDLVDFWLKQYSSYELRTFQEIFFFTCSYCCALFFCFFFCFRGISLVTRTEILPSWILNAFERFQASHTQQLFPFNPNHFKACCTNKPHSPEVNGTMKWNVSKVQNSHLKQTGDSVSLRNSELSDLVRRSVSSREASHWREKHASW